jgi:hypothetical protein
MLKRSQEPITALEAMTAFHSFTYDEAVRVHANFNSEERNATAKFTDFQFMFLQAALFQLMTSSYSFTDDELIAGMSYADARYELLEVMNKSTPAYAGAYHLLLQDAQLLPFHLDLISHSTQARLTGCADQYNDQMLTRREAYVEKFSVHIYKEAFYRWQPLRLDVDDKFKLMQTLNEEQMTVMNNQTNIYHLRSHMEWVIQTLMSYYRYDFAGANKVAVSMLTGDAMPPHLKSIGNVLYHFYKNIFSDAKIAFQPRLVPPFTVPVLNNDHCRFLASPSRDALRNTSRFYRQPLHSPASLEAPNTRRNSMVMDNCQYMLFAMLLLGAMGYSFYLFHRLTRFKNSFRRRPGFINNPRRKQANSELESIEVNTPARHT